MGLASSSLTFATDKSGAVRTMVLTLPATRKRFLPLPSRSIPSTPTLTPSSLAQVARGGTLIASSRATRQHVLHAPNSLTCMQLPVSGKARS